MASEEGSPIPVLVVTADCDFAAACERRLPTHGEFTVHTASTVGAAIDILRSDTPVDCIVSDHDLPDTDGVAFLEAVRAQEPILPFILFTTEGSETIASRAIAADMTEYLIKDVHSDQWGQLASLIEGAVTYYRNREPIVNTGARARELLDATDDDRVDVLGTIQVVDAVRDGRRRLQPLDGRILHQDVDGRVLLVDRALDVISGIATEGSNDTDSLRERRRLLFLFVVEPATLSSSFRSRSTAAAWSLSPTTITSHGLRSIFPPSTQ